MGNKKASIKRLNYIYPLTEGVSLGYIVINEITVPIIYQPILFVQVRPFRTGKQTSSDSNEVTPMADSSPGCERIKTDIILTCTPGVVLLINNLREILPIWQGSRFVFKKVIK